MKLSIDRNLLIKTINLVIKATDKRHRLPILANLKFELSADALLLTGSDLDLQLTAKLPLPAGACVEAGATTLPAEMFFNICKSLSDETVFIDAPSDGGRCLITSGKGKYNLVTLPAEDFPSIGTPNPTTVVNIAQRELMSLIHNTRFSIAIQDVRHYMTGMLVELQDNKLTAVATDGHRMAIAHRFLSETYPTSKAIIPGKAIAELERQLIELAKTNDTDTIVALGFDDDFLKVGLILTDDDQSNPLVLEVGLTARLIAGQFPDYRRVIPQDSDKIANFSKDETVEVLRRLSVFGSKDAPWVKMQFGQPDSVTVGAGDDKNGAEETLAIKYAGEPVRIAFNETYLRAVLNVLDGEIRLEMSKPGAPVLVHQVGDELHQYVVVPVRI